MSWDEDTDEKKSEPESPTLELGKFVVFMVVSNASFVQGSSDKESKSDEDIDNNFFSD